MRLWGHGRSRLRLVGHITHRLRLPPSHQPFEFPSARPDPFHEFGGGIVMLFAVNFAPEYGALQRPTTQVEGE